MRNYRDGAVKIANKLQRALGGDGWCVRHFNVDAAGAVQIVLEDYDGSSGTPYANVQIFVTYSLLEEE